MEKASVSVKIYNSTYALTTSASEEQVLKIAAEVDRRMQELAESKKLLQTDKIAIWTALDLAADRLELQEKCVALKQEMQQQSVAAEQKMQEKCAVMEQELQQKCAAAARLPFRVVKRKEWVRPALKFWCWQLPSPVLIISAWIISALGKK